MRSESKRTSAACAQAHGTAHRHLSPPDFLAKYQKSPEAVLGARVLPPQRQPLHPESPFSLPLRGHGKGSGKTGLRPTFETPTAMRYAIGLYFERLTITQEPPVVADLVLALGFASRKGLMSYKTRGEEFADVVDEAFTRIEAWKNKLLLRGGPTTTGVIFDLKNNHHWAEKTEQTTTIGAADSLTALVNALQGNVLRPILNVRARRIEEDIEDVELEDEDDPNGANNLIGSGNRNGGNSSNNGEQPEKAIAVREPPLLSVPSKNTPRRGIDPIGPLVQSLQNLVIDALPVMTPSLSTKPSIGTATAASTTAEPFDAISDII